MCSRYAAFALGREDHLFRTWHPRTRPSGPLTSDGVVWCGLRIIATEAGGPDDATGWVEFEADHRTGEDREMYTLCERSRFERRAGRWVYVDADA